MMPVMKQQTGVTLHDLLEGLIDDFFTLNACGYCC